MGKGREHVPRNCCKVLSVLQMLSKVSVDKVSMQHFKKMWSAFAPPKVPLGLCLWTSLGDFCPSDPLIAHPWKKILWAPMKTATLFRSH